MNFFKKQRKLIFLILSLLLITVSYFQIHNLSMFSFHRLCPFSAGCTLYKMADHGITYPIGLGFLVFLLTLSLFYRRIFCSTACPIGYIQEIMEYPRRFLKVRKKLYIVNIDDKISFITRGIIFSAAIFVPFFTGIFAFQKLCPIILTGDIIHNITFYVSLMTLIIFIVFSIIIERFFCKFVCPVGIMMGVAGWFGNKFLPTYTVKKLCASTSKCTICTNECQMNINLKKVKEEINHIDCIVCMECVKVCPRNKQHEHKKHIFFGRNK